MRDRPLPLRGLFNDDADRDPFRVSYRLPLITERPTVYVIETVDPGPFPDLRSQRAPRGWWKVPATAHALLVLAFAALIASALHLRCGR